jgi:hypothetical protein
LDVATQEALVWVADGGRPTDADKDAGHAVLATLQQFGNPDAVLVAADVAHAHTFGVQPLTSRATILRALDEVFSQAYGSTLSPPLRRLLIAGQRWEPRPSEAGWREVLFAVISEDLEI